MPFTIVKKQQTSQKPSEISRHAFRTLSDVGQGIARIPENISSLASLPAEGLNYLLSSLLKSATGQEIPRAPDVYPLPRSSTVKGAVQGLTEKLYGPETRILEPQHVLEDIISRTAQKAPASIATSLLTSGGSLLPSLAADVVSSAAGAGLKAAGAPAWAEQAGEVAGGILPALIKTPNILKKTVEKSEQEIAPLFAKRDEIAHTIPVVASEVKKDIDPLLHLVETKAKSFSKPLVDFVKEIGEEYSAHTPQKTIADLLATKSAASGFFKQGKNDGKLIGKLTKTLDSLIQDYGKKNKEFMQVYKESNDLYSMFKKNFPEIKSLLNIPQENAPKLAKSIGDYVIPGGALTAAFYQASNGNFPRALQILAGGAGVHLAHKYIKNPISAFKLLYKSPKVREIMKEFATEEAKKNPDVAARLFNQIVDIGESKGIISKPKKAKKGFTVIKKA